MPLRMSLTLTHDVPAFPICLPCSPPIPSPPPRPAVRCGAAKERVVGWYSTGPKIRESDLDIQELFYNYCSDPVLVIIDVQPRELAIPSQAYCTVEDVKEDGTQKSQKAFVHISSEIGAYEAEEIGVEHLLRDVKDATITTLASEVSAKLVALKGLESRLRQLRSYLDLVAAGRLPLRADILYGVQDAFNLLPNLNVDDLVKAFAVRTNDMTLAVYVASLVRSIIALHNLINNKVVNKEAEKAVDSSAATPVPSAAS
ncbi:unnamed protein product [Closterium sp. Yama58-4]|nr:unnamed protein product [Closterium sp. Yama58-4]